MLSTNSAAAGPLYDRPMRLMQFVIVTICCLTNIADGADIAALAFSAPVLIKDWGLSPGVMGSLFGATAIGLATGAFLIAPVADRIGRRPLTLSACGILAVIMFLTAHTTSIAQFAILRFITGLCLGTLAVTLNVMVSEFSSGRWRNPLVSLLHTGFSLGTMTGGALAATLLEPYGWRAMFMATALLNTATFVLVLLFVTESPSFLIAKAGAGALEKLNRVFARLGQEPLTQLPEMPEGRKKSRVSTLMSTGGAKSTILLWASQFIFAVISYLILNWKPTVLVNTGLTPTEAGYAGLASGAAGVVGHIVIGFTSREGREVSSTAFFFLLLCISLLLFALLPPTPWGLILSAGFTSFCNVGVFTGLVLIAIALYPPQVRTTSVGVLIGISRLGAITGPLFGGLLLELGFERMGMFVLLAGLSILPIIAMRFVGLPSRQPKAA